MAKTTSRTIRFTREELEDIAQFLKENPFFDFSSVVRTSVSEFIRRPTIEIRPIPKKSRSIKKREETAHV